MDEREKRILVCPHCGNRTPHKLVFEHHYSGEWYDLDGHTSEEPFPDSVYMAFECATCHDLCLYELLEVQDFDEATLVFPKGSFLDNSIPETVKSNYEEAKRVQKISPNAFAVLIRRALEALCDDRNVPQGRLQQRLEELSKRGEIPPVLAEITSVLRTIGNSGAHNTHQKVTVPMTWRMEEFFRTLVEYVYVAPARLNEFRSKIADADMEEDG